MTATRDEGPPRHNFSGAAERHHEKKVTHHRKGRVVAEVPRYVFMLYVCMGSVAPKRFVGVRVHWDKATPKNKTSFTTWLLGKPRNVCFPDNSPGHEWPPPFSSPSGVGSGVFAPSELPEYNEVNEGDPICGGMCEEKSFCSPGHWSCLESGYSSFSPPEACAASGLTSENVGTCVDVSLDSASELSVSDIVRDHQLHPLVMGDEKSGGVQEDARRKSLLGGLRRQLQSTSPCLNNSR